MGLRERRKRDRAAFEALVSASADFLRPWEPRQDPEQDRFGRLLAKNRREDQRRMLVWRLEDGLLLGVMNINNIVRGVFPSASPGYMQEALALALRHGFDTLGATLGRLEKKAYGFFAYLTAHP